MAETLTTLKTRRSCRAYKPELIEEGRLYLQSVSLSGCPERWDLSAISQLKSFDPYIHKNACTCSGDPYGTGVLYFYRCHGGLGCKV